MNKKRYVFKMYSTWSSKEIEAEINKQCSEHGMTVVSHSVTIHNLTCIASVVYRVEDTDGQPEID